MIQCRKEWVRFWPLFQNIICSLSVGPLCNWWLLHKRLNSVKIANISANQVDMTLWQWRPIKFLNHVPYSPSGGRGNKKQGSYTIMSTSFALKFRSNEIIDVGIILSFTLIHSSKVAQKQPKFFMLNLERLLGNSCWNLIIVIFNWNYWKTSIFEKKFWSVYYQVEWSHLKSFECNHELAEQWFILFLLFQWWWSWMPFCRAPFWPVPLPLRPLAPPPHSPGWHPLDDTLLADNKCSIQHHWTITLNRMFGIELCSFFNTRFFYCWEKKHFLLKFKLNESSRKFLRKLRQ